MKQKLNTRQVKTTLISLLIFTFSSFLPAEANRRSDEEVAEKHYVVFSAICENLEAFQYEWFDGRFDDSARVLIRMVKQALESEEYRQSKTYLYGDFPVAEFLSRKDRFVNFRDLAFETEYDADLAEIGKTEQDRILRRFRDLVTKVYERERGRVTNIRFRR